MKFPEGDLEMIRWHDREHVGKRVGIPGFRRGRRYDISARHLLPSHLDETDSAETVEARLYLLRLNFPTEWTKRVLPHSLRPPASAARPCSPRAAVRAARS